MKRQYERLREGLRDEKRQERDYLAGKGREKSDMERGRGRGARWG
jgi:hypothetical protein